MRNGSEPNAATAEMMARVLIVDDEMHARHYLRELLEGEPHVEVVGEGSNGVQGVQQIRDLMPDIVFVDIQMPGLDGFGMIDQSAGSRPPLFVFVTGYSEYAVKAFEVEAVDYVQEPFDKARLSISIERALRRLSSTFPGAVISQWLTRRSIKDDERFLFVPVN